VDLRDFSSKGTMKMFSLRVALLEEEQLEKGRIWDSERLSSRPRKEKIHNSYLLYCCLVGCEW